jgi:hypothetical protein
MLKTSDFLYVIHYAIVMRVNGVDMKRKEPKKKGVEWFHFPSVHFVKKFMQVTKSDSCKNKTIHALPEKKSAISLKSIGIKKVPFTGCSILLSKFNESAFYSKLTPRAIALKSSVEIVDSIRSTKSVSVLPKSNSGATGNVFKQFLKMKFFRRTTAPDFCKV